MPENREIRNFTNRSDLESFLGPYLRYVDFRTIPKILYHYTTPSGLLGILHDKSAWATHLEHFNDAGELSYAHDLLEQAVGEYLSKFPETDKNAWEALGAFLKVKRGKIPSDDVYVVSFSEKGDLLSQWERYAQGHGYSIGFDTSALCNTLLPATAQLMPVMYAKSEQLDLLGELLAVAFTTLASTSTTPTMEEAVIWANLYAKVFRLICTAFKDQAFEEEAEWRIVRSLPRSLNPIIRFRPGRFGVVPFIEHPLGRDEILVISQIYIAPTHYFHESERAVELCLLQKNVSLSSDNIIQSKVPLRV